MSVLLELSKRHKEWLKMATRISGCSDKAKDLVQDMYLKIGLSECEIKKEYSNFIYTIMSNIFSDQLRKSSSYKENKNRVYIQKVSLDDDFIKFNNDFVTFQDEID